jgi:hypothetical protein
MYNLYNISIEKWIKAWMVKFTISLKTMWYVCFLYSKVWKNLFFFFFLNFKPRTCICKTFKDINLDLYDTHIVHCMTHNKSILYTFWLYKTDYESGSWGLWLDEHCFCCRYGWTNTVLWSYRYKPAVLGAFHNCVV